MHPGDTVAGKYRLNHPLGSGGMADVWAATNTFTERQVAIKFMHGDVAKTPASAARFLKEAKVSARVNHPNIVDVLDVGQTEDRQLFLVMELLTGAPLDVAMRRVPPMTAHELVRIMIEVGEALAAAHKAGIVHRDLKPTNIFLHQVKGVLAPKLLDFGVSKFLEEDTNHALTVAGTVLGSPLYMSPEQARGETNLDGRTDVFAFGAILFEALCGYRAYEAKNFNALIVKIATTRPQSIDACAPHLPESLRRVVRACMETDLAARAQSLDAVLAMLREALPELQASSLRLAIPVAAASDPAASAASAPHASGSSEAWPGGTAGSRGSWHTPNPSYASVVSVPPPRRRGHGALVAGSAALAVVGVLLGALAARSPRASTATARAPEEAASTVPAALAAHDAGTSEIGSSSTTAASGASSQVLTVSVDALPGASREAAR